jgi:formiminotetrahydrofolate cyclodeaminase
MSSFADMTVQEFLEATAAKTPTPGGGAVASAVAALGSALAQMVVNYSIGKKNLASFEPHLRGSVMRLTRAREILLGLAQEDAEAYGLVNELSRLPEGDARRQRELPEAQRAAVQVPMSVIAASVDLLRHFEDLAKMTNRHLRSDLAIAAVLADAAARASRWNVLVNIPSLDEAARLDASRLMNGMLSESAKLVERVENACRE